MATALAFAEATTTGDDDFSFLAADLEELLFCDSLAGAGGESGGSSEMEAFVRGLPASSSFLAAEVRREPNIADRATRWTREKRTKMDPGHRISFRARSAVEVIDDGYKWRKYGKKSVKDSPNPRNYYRCSTEGCMVKKRVQRDCEDPSYVITTYDGVHNHLRPAFTFYPHHSSRLVSLSLAPPGGGFTATGRRQPVLSTVL
ncbi:unnamed protein product [Spirodela intermedia]|uniref:WRKY domain-containing protein n=1 Tax=Spirodela intermedia TaxID=51605 RepID=A0A7I8JT30_SPIIN|nr:unnamed protein product [Spirodela intermedia]CAA6672763.1 unnamed protein product [Spirodela intermedia]